MLSLINPVRRPEPFDHPDWLFEAKFDGFRTAADTTRGQLIHWKLECPIAIDCSTNRCIRSAIVYRKL